MNVNNRLLGNWGKRLSTLASTILLLAGSERLGAAIQRQWIKDLRTVANEMEQELTNGKTSHSDQV